MGMLAVPGRPARRRHPARVHAAASDGEFTAAAASRRAAGWTAPSLARVPRSRLGGRPLGRHVGPVDKYGFNPNVYGAWGSGGSNRSLQYVTDGLKARGGDLVVARDAIIYERRRSCRRRRHVRSGRLSHGAGSATARSRGRLIATTTARRSTRTRTARKASSEAWATNVVERDQTSVYSAARLPLGGNQGLDIFASGSPYSSRSTAPR